MCRRSNPIIEKRSHWVRTMTRVGCNLQIRQWRFSWRLYNSWEEAKLPSDVPPNQSQHVTVKPFLFFFVSYIDFSDSKVKKCLQQLWQMVVYKYASVLCLRNSTPCRHLIDAPVVQGSCRWLLSFLSLGANSHASEICLWCGAAHPHSVKERIKQINVDGRNTE